MVFMISFAVRIKSNGMQCEALCKCFAYTITSPAPNPELGTWMTRVKAKVPLALVPGAAVA